MRVELTTAQIEAIKLYKKLGEGILADKVGFGKTFPLLELSDGLKSVYFTSVPGIAATRPTIARFYPDREVFVLAVPQSERVVNDLLAKWQKSKDGILLLSYSCYQAKNYSAVRLFLSTRKTYVQAIFYDEVHRAGGPKTKTFKSLSKFVRNHKDVKYTISASGTPTLGSLPRMWGPLFLKSRGKIDSYYKWQSTHFKKEVEIFYRGGSPITIAKYREPKDYQAWTTYLKEQGYLSRGIDKTSTRFSVKNIAILLDMTKEQRKLYDECRKEIILEYEGTLRFIPYSSTRFIRLAQICLDPSVAFDNPLLPIKNSPKVDWLVDKLDSDFANSKIAVFSHSAVFIMRLRKHLTDMGFKVFSITSDCLDIQKEQEAYAKYEGQAIMIFSLKGKEAIDLTCTNAFISMSRPSYSDWEQVQGRFFRHLAMKHDIQHFELSHIDSYDEVVSVFNESTYSIISEGMPLQYI